MIKERNDTNIVMKDEDPDNDVIMDILAMVEAF